MKRQIIIFAALFLGLIMLCGCKKQLSGVSGLDLSKYFENCEGCAVFLKGSDCYVYNDEISGIQKSPCSTFKIVLTLAGLKYGVLKDENTVIKWDGEKRYFDEWNKDLSLKEAFSVSAVWYFEKVANEIGKEKLTEFIDSISYGNCDTCDEIPFWVDSSLKISPKEQAKFLQNLFDYKLSADKDDIDILKKVMYKEDLNGGALYGKTGTSIESKLGWFVGFYEKEGEKIYFAVEILSGESGKHAEKMVKNMIRDYF